jgi:hypothetical protein
MILVFDKKKDTVIDTAILWFGKVATFGYMTIKPGVHQVLYPKESGTPRMSMWYEVCVSKQVIVVITCFVFHLS